MTYCLISAKLQHVARASFTKLQSKKEIHMATVSELKIDALRREIAVIEDTAKAKTTPMSELAAAHAAVDGCERLINISRARQNDTFQVLENFQKRAGGLIGPALQKLQSQIAGQENEIRALTAERDGIQTDLRAHRATLAELTAKIEAHPIYASIRAKQSELILQATEIAKASWIAPLNTIHKLISKLEHLSTTESRLLSSCVAEIRAAGLPEISPKLSNLIVRISPSFIAEERLRSAWTEASEEIQRLSEDAARVKAAR
jgi:chromosome segregation ATPase